MLLRFGYFIFFLLNFHQLISSQANQDIQHFNEAENCFQELNYQCALENYEKYLATLDSSSNFKKYYDTYLRIGKSYFELGELENSLKILERIKQQPKIETIDSVKAAAMQIRGQIFWRQGRNVNAIDEILQSISYFETLGDTSSVVKSSNTLGGIYVSLGEYDKGQNIYRKSLDLATRINDSTNIAFSNEYLGIIEYFKGNYEKALERYQKTLAINKALKDSIPISINLSNIGEAYIELSQPKLALDYFKKCVEIQERYNFMSGLVFSYYSLGRVHTSLSEYKKGLNFYDKSLAVMAKSGETRERNYVYRLISENYEVQGNPQKSLEYFKKYATEKDSIFNLDKDKQLREIRARYDFNKKEQQNRILKLENDKNLERIEANEKLIRLQYSIGILISIFLIIFIFLAVNLYRTRQTLAKANQSKDKLFGIIAHDLKGPIRNIGRMLDLMSIEKDSKNQQQYIKYLLQTVGNLSELTDQLLSWTFSHKGEFNVKIEKILVSDITKASVDLFKYELNEKKITVNTDVPDDLMVAADENALLTIIRNILSNAIKFSEPESDIKLTAQAKGNFVEIKIQDSGVGMSSSMIQKIKEGKHLVSSSGTANEQGSGLGFSIITEFIKKLKGKIDIESDGKSGTSIIIQLKRAV